MSGTPLEPTENKYSCDSVPVQNRSLTIEWLTTEEAAEYLKVSVQALRNLTSNGKIPYYKFGKRVRFKVEELRELLLKNPRGGFYGNKTR